MGILERLLGKQAVAGTQAAATGHKGGTPARGGKYPTTCAVCGRTDLKMPHQLGPNDSLDEVSRACPRCLATYCVNDVRNLAKHGDGFGSKCSNCGEYSIFELSGKPNWDWLAEESIRRYGWARDAAPGA